MNQIDKNTVSAKGQLKESEFVTFLQNCGDGKRYLFVGNSITRHGIAPKIGWNQDCGMAASALEKDYVHLLATKIREKDPDAVFCICQAAEWERNYRDPAPVLHLFENARDFCADVIVMRIVENCPYNDFDVGIFGKTYPDFISFLNPTGKAQIVLTTGFWKHPGDASIQKIAARNGYPCVDLNALGEDPAMKAIGLFEHTGVANHPGDHGMKTIADMIFAVI
ncbi:MAG: hypothetical protein J6C26_00505 [Clostridia bacterium]|nr:hypothetical protein [Clostridia bacterium]